MGFKFGSRLDPKAASAKGSDDSGAAEDTPLNRLRAGLGLQPAAPALSASAVVEARRVEPQISRPGDAPASLEMNRAAVMPSEPKPIAAKPVEVKAPEIKAPEAKAPEAPEVRAPEVKAAEAKPVEVKPAEVKPAEVKAVDVKPVEAKPVEAKAPEPKPAPTITTTPPRPAATPQPQRSASAAPVPQSAPTPNTGFSQSAEKTMDAPGQGAGNNDPQQTNMSSSSSEAIKTGPSIRSGAEQPTAASAASAAPRAAAPASPASPVAPSTPPAGASRPIGAAPTGAAPSGAVASGPVQNAAPGGTPPAGVPPRAPAAATPPLHAAELVRSDAPSVPVEYSGPTTRDDALLSCLVIMTRIFGSPKSPAALSAGLPIGDEGMTPDLFMRAADRSSLSASQVRRKLDQVDKMSLPAVLLLKNRKACVLLAPPRAGMAEIATPDNLDGSHSYPLAELEAVYTGVQLLVRPKIRLDSRSADLTEARPRNWFWTNVAKFMPVYGEVVVAALLINIFTIATSIFSMQVYDRVVPNKAEGTMWVLAIGAITIFFFDFILRTLRAYFLDKAGKSLDRKVSSSLFEHVLSIRMSSGPQSAGAFASNIQSYETLRDFFTSATLSALIDLPFVLVFLVIIFVIAGAVAIVPAILVPAVILVSFAVQAPMQKAVERSYREMAQKHAMLVETINGLDTIKTASAEGQMQRDWDGYVAASSSSAAESRFWSTIAINFVVMASNLAFVGVLMVGCYEIFSHDPTSPYPALTTGAMVAASMLTSRAMAPLGQIAGLIVRFHQSWTSLKGLNRLMDLPVERPQGKVFLRRPRIDGAIEFRNVVFKYPNAQTPALDGVSFRIAPGERVGIVGRIGSGKTTIERLVMGLFEPTDGAVLVDGTDIRQLDPTDLRQSIGCVLQDPHLFFGSVKDNITLGAPYVDEESFLRAATLAGVDQFVRQHPSGYDMPTGENGRYLSGGQRQSVAVARALLLNPPILVLDEPTSSMDNSTENTFKTRLGEIVPGKTLLLVTHRNSMLSLVDRLIVLDRGKVVADGPKAGVLDALMKGRIRANEG
jgi:ATP-binding cassette subfamily C protein LapB